MTLSDIAARLRQLAEQLQREEKYDPKTDIIAVVRPSGVHFGCMLETHIYPVLLDARNRGAFNTPRLIDFKRRIDPTKSYPPAESTSGVLDEMGMRGFDCWGLDAKRGAIERLADAFAALGSEEATFGNLAHNGGADHRIPDSERQALQWHAAAIDQYEAGVQAEEERLEVPFAAAKKEWWIQEHSPSLARPAHGPPVMADITFPDDSLPKEILRVREVGLAEYAKLHPRPDLEPWDTPGKIIEWIDDRAFAWSVRRKELLASSSLGQSILDAEINLTEARARPVYQLARSRVLAFAGIAPSVNQSFPETLDAVIGLQDIRAWCEETRRVAPVAAGQTGGGAAKPRRKRRETAKPMTARQAEAVQLFGECKGNFAQAATAMGVDRKTFIQHYRAAMKKMGRTAMLKPKTRRLATDLRGQVQVSEDRR